MDKLKVAYLLWRFPSLTETFIADEIWELQRHDTQVILISLLKPKAGPVHHFSERLAVDTKYAPALHSAWLWWAQLFFLFKSPLTYFGAFFQLIRQPYPSSAWREALKRILIFWKAVWVALILRDREVELVHAHFAALPGAAGMVVSKLLRIPLTCTVHAYDVYASNHLLRLTASSSSRIVAISEYNKQQVLEMCPEKSSDSISVIHCGIRRDLFVAGAGRDSRQGPLQILAVGSLIEKKGHSYLIKACQELKGRGIDFRCTIIGGGPGEEELKQLVREYGLQSMVSIAGPRNRDEVLEAYSNADLFILACAVAPDGDRDGIPVVLMEAMAMQVPVISTSVSGIPELVQHKKTGWLVPERNAMAIADAAVELQQSADLRRRLTTNAVKKVEAEFDIKSNALRLSDLFRIVSRVSPEDSVSGSLAEDLGLKQKASD